jgi:hypothetical protein
MQHSQKDENGSANRDHPRDAAAMNASRGGAIVDRGASARRLSP